MNYYEHHLGDWAKKCAHLSLAEEGAYRRLLDWYYSNERPLPSDIKMVRKLARCTSTGERKAVDKVLHYFFEPMEDGWHQSRVDRELEAFAKRLPVTLAARDSVKDRQHKSREKRAAMFRVLDENGIHAPWNATNNVLYELFHEHGLRVPVTAPATAPATATVTGTQAPSSIYSAPVTGRAIAVTGEEAPLAGYELDPLGHAEKRAEAARAVKKAGLTSVNPLDPRFMAIIDNGATVNELAVIATEAALKGKGWAWFLATVKGRREDAARAASMPQEAPQTYRQRAAAATVQAWVPQLAAKPQS